MAYESEGTLVTDEREIAISSAWDSQTDWEAFQSATNVAISNGVVMLDEITIPNTGDHQWHMDEGSGTTLNDSVGTVTATVNGATWVTNSPSVGGYHLSHDGTDDYAVTDSSVDAAQSQFTLFGWAQIDTFSGFNHALAGAANTGTAGTPGWYIFTEDTAGEIGVVMGQGSAVRNVPFPSSGWGFVAMIADGDQARLITFDNSSELADTTGSSGSRGTQSGDNLQLGRNGDGGMYFDGSLDFWGWANSHLTKTEITELWDASQR